VRDFADRVADDVVCDDRRSGLRNTTRGREALLASMEALELPITSVETIARRGERLALKRVLRRGPASHGGGDAEVAFLVLHEFDDSGQLATAVMFDANAVDEAVGELDDRFVAGEGAEYSNTLRLTRAFVETFNTRDWTAFADLLAPGFRSGDHRPTGKDFTNRQEFLSYVRTAPDLAPDIRMIIVAHHRLDERAGLATVRSTGTGLGGSDFESVRQVLGLIEDGHFVGMESFPPEQLQEAIARFDELTAEDQTAPDVLTNAAVRMSARGYELSQAGQWDAVAEMLSEDAVAEDRRSGIRTVVSGRDAMLRALHALFDGGVRVRHEVIAIRGERLALARQHFSGSGRSQGSYEATTLEVVEMADDGRSRGVVHFDEDDVDAAMAELDDRHLAGEGALYAETLRLGRRFVDATMARDWDAVRSLFETDFVFVEHGNAGFGTLSLEEYMAAQQAMVELAPDVRVDIVKFDRVEDNGAVGQVHQTSSGMAGGYTQTRAVIVALHRGGRFRRLERFPVDQLDTALRRFDELTA
jgi:hypothetical protein